MPRPVLYKKAFVKATPDTAAQITLAGSDLLNRLKISRRDLIQVSQRIKGVSNQTLHILGALLLDITGQDKDRHSIKTKELVYIAEGATEVLLSKRVCQELGIIPSNFPTIGAHEHGKASRGKGPITQSVNTIFTDTQTQIKTDTQTQINVISTDTDRQSPSIEDNKGSDSNIQMQQQTNGDEDLWTHVMPRRRRRRRHQHQEGRFPGRGDRYRYHTKYGPRAQLPACTDTGADQPGAMLDDGRQAVYQEFSNRPELIHNTDIPS